MNDLFSQPAKTIDFEIVSQRPHNNAESDAQVKEHYKAFAGQTRWVFDQLMQGRILTGEIAYSNRIKDLRARCHSIKLAGLLFTPETIPNTNGSRKYYMNHDQIRFNKMKLQSNSII